MQTAYPAANVGDLQRAAAIWTNLATTIRDNYGTANSAASSMVSNNSGQAIQAFETYWSKFGGKSGMLLNLAEACDNMANACSHYGSDVGQTQHNMEVAGAEVLAVMTIASLAALFTFSATEAAAAAAISWLGDTVASLLTWLATAAGDAVSIYLDGLAALVSSELATNLVAAGVTASVTNASAALAADSAKNALSQLTGTPKLSPADVQKDLVSSGLQGAFLAGPIGELIDMGKEPATTLLLNGASAVTASDPALAAQLAATAQLVNGVPGKLSASVITSMATQLYAAQQVSGQNVVSDTLQDQLIKAVEGKAGG